MKRDRAKSDHAGYLCKDALCPSLQGLHGFSHCCHNLRSDSDIRHTEQANHSAKHQTLPDYHIDPHLFLFDFAGVFLDALAGRSPRKKSSIMLPR